MKKLILLLILFSRSALGQTPYLGFDSHWEERSTFMDISGDYFHVENYVYEFRSDTIINSKTYYQLFRAGNDTGYSTFDQSWYVFSINQPAGFIREDSMTKRIYYIPVAQTYEYLLYDFSISAGDSIPDSYGFPGCDPGNVVSVDTFSFGIQPRKRLNFNTPNNIGHLIILEGIAANSGLLGFMCLAFDGISTCLKGFYNSTDTVRFVDCSSPVSIEEISDSRIKVDVFPNPSFENLTIRIRTPFESASYCIMDLSGKIIMQTTNIENSFTEVNMHGVSAGIYILRIIANEKSCYLKIVSN